MQYINDVFAILAWLTAFASVGNQARKIADILKRVKSR